MTLPRVMTVADARAGLSGILRSFRNTPGAPNVVIGSHRNPEAVLVPYHRDTANDRGIMADTRIRMLDRLQGKRDLIRRIAQLNSLQGVRVFGSVARGEETETSDVDLLVEPTDAMSLFDIAQFEIDMEALLERKVDVVSVRSLDRDRDAHIIAESIPL